MSRVLTIQEIELAIGIKTSEWIRECCFISAKVLYNKLLEGKLIMGKYKGMVSPQSIFAEGGPITEPMMHCWIELSDGVIVDVTRWTITGEPPFVYIAKSDPDYIEGNEYSISACL